MNILLPLSMLLTASCLAQNPIRLWPSDAPGALGHEERDTPKITPYLAGSGTGAAFLVCPGGGYGGLASHEGKDYAVWLNQLGISAFVLQYRLGSHGYHHPAMLQDASRALRLLRARAEEFHIDPKRIGIMGSSAGGHLASTLLTHFDEGQASASDPVERQSSRPDLGILCYPVVSMGPITHLGSRKNLLGDDPSEELIEQLSNEEHVTARTPPCFIWHTWEDQAVKVENSLEFAAALRRAGIPFDLHIYQKGRHGLGLGDKPPFEHPHPWAADCAFWLREQHYAQPNQP